MTPECRRVDERLLDLIYEELGESEQAELKAHVAGCSRCSQEVESLAGTRAALRALPDEEPPDAISTRLMHEAAAPRTWAQKLAALFTLHPAWSYGAAAAVVLIASLALFTRSKSVEEMVVEREGGAMRAPEPHEELPVASKEVADKKPGFGDPAPDDLLPGLGGARGEAPAAEPPEAPASRVAEHSDERTRSRKKARSSASRPREPQPAPSPRAARVLRKKTKSRDLKSAYGFEQDLLGGGATGSSGLESRGALDQEEAMADSAPAPSPAETIHKEGDRLRRKGDCGGAVKVYERVIRDFPDYQRLALVRQSLSACRQALRREGDPSALPSEPAAEPAK